MTILSFLFCRMCLDPSLKWSEGLWFAGFFRCQPSVLMGRPISMEQTLNLIKTYKYVKAVGVGHSWWQEQFCSGNTSDAMQMVMTEYPEVLAV
jgi:hypothetical protein